MADITGMLQAAAGTGQQYVAIGFIDTPWINVYPWTSTGFGAKFSNAPTLPPTFITDISFHPLNNAIAFTAASTVYAFPWSSNGFGTRFTNPVTTVGGAAVDFHPSGNAIATIRDTSGATAGIHAYQWSNSGFGSGYTNLGSLNFLKTGTFSPNGDSIVVAGTTISGSYVQGYGFSVSSGFSTLASPFVSNGGFTVGKTPSFTPNQDAVVFALGFSAVVYAWSASGFGSQFSGPGVPTDSIDAAAFSKTGDAIAMAVRSSPYIAAYAWSSGFGTRFSDPSVLPAGAGRDISFSPDNKAVAIAHDTSPYISAYSWSDSTGFGAKFSNPATLPTANGIEITFSRS
jgi:hypothetical protein